MQVAKYIRSDFCDFQALLLQLSIFQALPQLIEDPMEMGDGLQQVRGYCLELADRLFAFGELVRCALCHCAQW